MLKKVFLALIITLFTAFISSPVLYAFSDPNLVLNGGFEEASGNLPLQWKFDSFNGPEASEFILESQSYSGSYCLSVNNKKEDDSKAYQTIIISPGSSYLVSCYIKTENIENQAGSANITIMQDNAVYTSKEFSETDGQWNKLEFYIKSLENFSAEFKLILRLGGQGTLNRGKAYFDEISLVQVSELTESIPLVEFYIPDSTVSKPVSDNNDHKTGNAGSTVSNSSSANNKLLIIGGLFLLVVIIAIEVLVSKKRRNNPEDKEPVIPDYLADIDKLRSKNTYKNNDVSIYNELEKNKRNDLDDK